VKLPEKLKPLFWNYDPETLDMGNFKKNIILEVLARGSLEDADIIFQFYGRDAIATVFREDFNGPRTLPAPAVYLWEGLFLTEAEFEDYKMWHRHPLRKWEQRRVITAKP
jgi:hypothetical protein